LAQVPTYQTEAVVLRRLDYGEADRILTLLTRERGKLAAIAKGVRRRTGRLGGLDLFAHSKMMLARGRNLDVVAQVQDRGDMRHIAGDLQRTAYASLVAEVVDKVLEDRHPMDDVFDLVVTTLTRLNVPERSPRADAAWFLMRMLDLLGYLPQLTSCPSCAQPLPEAAGWFSSQLGGVVCTSCAGRLDDASAVSVTALKVLRVMALGDEALYDRLRLTDALLQEVEQVLETQLEYHLDRHIKSLDVIRSLG
jgi:DNA repair protein RecO (recombination protein O)